MASLISKRQQARNEKALQELMHSVPGNKMCADCGLQNPSWASWSLGIFLCMRCASIHRKLGTHISKVKSLSMDGWTNDQVDNMRKVGNVTSNKVYNPQNKKPPVPIDADEADSAMERFIRSKYAQVPSATGNAGRPGRSRSVESDEGTPPPLPPKTGSKFFKPGSIFRSNKKSLESQHGPRSPPADLRNKPSKVFGASVQHDTIDDTAQKLSQLREMGFADDKRNAMVLKGVNGNLEKTIEALVRLGEGGGVSPSLTTPRQESFPSFPPQTSHSLGPPPRTPTSSSMSRLSPAASPASNNPWDMPPAQPQSSQSTGTLPNRNPFLSTNPFGMPAQQAEFTLNQSLQNLSLAPSQQPQQLFPHHTGGIPVSQPVQQPLYQQSMTPPIPQSQNFASVSFNNNQTYPQPAQPAQNNYNPFLQAPGPQPPQNLSLNTSNVQSQQGAFGNNPFARSPTRLTSPTLGQIPEQTQQNFYASSQSLYGNNPFLAMGQPAQQMSYGQPLQQQQQFQPQAQQQQFQPQAQQQPQGFEQTFYQPQQQQQQQQPQAQTPWHDKASIMALYNYPPAPAPTQQPQEQAPQSATEAPAAQQQQQQQQQPQRSVSTPLPGHNNPFLNGSMGTAPTAPSYGAAPQNPISGGGGSSRSRESMTFGMEMAWNNGRHSPDAFASLSSRTG